MLYFPIFIFVSISKKFCHYCTLHELRRHISSILIHQFLHIFTLNLATSVIWIEIESQHYCAKNCYTYVRNIEPKNVNYDQSKPNECKQGLSPPKNLIVCGIEVFFIHFTLEFPKFLTFLIEIDPPSQPDQDSSAYVFNNPKINCSSNNNKLQWRCLLSEKRYDKVHSENSSLKKKMNCRNEGIRWCI